MKKIELLAPAKNLEAGITAIQCGADAVYIGANYFGARIKAGNTLEDIEKLVNFGHKYFAKVYITINTILNNKEIPVAERLIRDLYDLGADAVIIQDMGLLELDLPPVPLFASTQAHNNTLKKVQFLEKVGFQRVILARELSLEQIKEIKSKTNVDLEAFIHGALCVCYSGQCYLSFINGGRSGNRGECAQPCRKKFSLIDSTGKILAKDKHLLSLKDLNLSNHLEDLIKAGVTSFKIEGRLKDTNYAKNIVTYYRQKIDDILDETLYAKASSGKIFCNFTPDPNKTFNRNYTEYFLKGRSRDITAWNSPKHAGENIGKVLSVSGQYFKLDKIDKKLKLNNGDGITFFDADNNLMGTVINKVEGNKVFPDKMTGIKNGITINRNLDHQFLKTLKSSEVKRKIGVKIKFFQQNDELTLFLEDEDGIKAEKSIKIEFDIAQNTEIATENYKKNLTKLGDSDFYAQDFSIDMSSIYFISSSILNSLRREALILLAEQRLKAYNPLRIKISPNNFPYPEKKLTYTSNVLNDYAKKFYQRHGVTEISPAAESGLNLQGEKIMTTKLCLKYQLGMCGKNSDPELFLIEENQRYKLIFDCKKCEMSILYCENS